jgi:hypothetical protein
MRKMITTIVATATFFTLSGLVASPTSARAVWDTTPVHVVHDVRPTPQVVDLRVGQHPAYDRVVVDFQGKLAGYDIRYVNELHYDGSGGQVPLKGQRFIEIRISPAVAPPSSEITRDRSRSGWRSATSTPSAYWRSRPPIASSSISTTDRSAVTSV